MEGKKTADDKMQLINIIKRLEDNGATGIILGCTELPLIISQKDINLRLFDTINILAETTVDLCIEKSKENLNKQSTLNKSKEKTK